MFARTMQGAEVSYIPSCILQLPTLAIGPQATVARLEVSHIAHQPTMLAEATLACGYEDAKGEAAPCVARLSDDAAAVCDAVLDAGLKV